jgi:hypothetical protein
VLQVSKRARTEHTILEDEDADPISVIESASSVAAKTVSDYQPSSILSQIDQNNRAQQTRRKSAPSKENALGKENAPIFGYDKPAHTPGPRGRNKRAHQDQVDFTMSAPAVRFTNRAGLQDERRTRQFTRKHTDNKTHK